MPPERLSAQVLERMNLPPSVTPTVLELCAGAGGQALGLELAGFGMVAAVEIEARPCATLRANRPAWDVREQDIHDFNGREFGGIDLVAAGVPCPPFSIAGKQLGPDDERDLFPPMLRIVREVRPRAVLIENVRGLMTKRFDGYRKRVSARLARLGYGTNWRVLNASAFGVPQLRPRTLMVALREEDQPFFEWPEGDVLDPPTVGEALGDLMAERGWPGAGEWIGRASAIAPTLTGGSKKHGGPDLGPTRAREQWARLGVDGLGMVEHAPDPDFPVDGLPRLTTRMTARLQGFPDSWEFDGRKTARHRQIGNAFPPPVAQAVGEAIIAAFARESRSCLLEERAAYEA